MVPSLPLAASDWRQIRAPVSEFVIDPLALKRVYELISAREAMRNLLNAERNTSEIFGQFF